MKEASVDIGKVYALRSQTGGQVTDENGNILETLEPNVQLRTMAQEQKWLVPDDCKVTKGNFKRALAALFLLGEGNTLPAGYTRLEFLEGTGTQYVDTRYIPNATSGLRCTQYTDVDHDFISFGCRNNASTHTRFACARERVGKAKHWTLGYGWGEWKDLREAADDDGTIVSRAYGVGCLNWLNSNRADYEDFIGGGKDVAELPELGFTPNFPVFLFACNIAEVASYPLRGRIYNARISEENRVLYDLVPALDPTGAPCMFDTVSRTAFKNAGTGQFIVGMTLTQVRALRLPAGGGELTLSLPHEASIDKLAQSALERARANGWVLTLQYAEAEVPAGYRRLEFLESTGTQYIDSGVPYANDTCIETIFEITQFNDVYSPGLFGTENSNNANESRFGVVPYTNYFRWDYGSKLKDDYVSRSLNTKYKLKKDGPDNYIDDVLISSNMPGDFISDRTGLIFTRNSYGGQFSGKIYSFSISRAGKMQVDYVPCIAPDGTLGMYNRVDGTVQENAGSGQFIAGLATVDDVRKLWLLETGGELTISVPADTPDSAVEQLRKNNPTWQIAIQYRTENNEN